MADFEKRKYNKAFLIWTSCESGLRLRVQLSVGVADGGAQCCILPYETA